MPAQGISFKPGTDKGTVILDSHSASWLDRTLQRMVLMHQDRINSNGIIDSLSLINRFQIQQLSSKESRIRDLDERNVIQDSLIIIKDDRIMYVDSLNIEYRVDNKYKTLQIDQLESDKRTRNWIISGLLTLIGIVLKFG